MNTPAPHNDDGVHVQDLRYSYGDYEAVRGVGLHARTGEVFALLGTNGAGKTTTLELLQGYRKPAGGTIRVLGHDPVRQGRALRRRTGFMLQEAGFLPELTVAETLRLWSRISSRADSVDDLLKRVDLVHRRDVRIDKLSGGEKRRVDIALTVWGHPDLVVLDEPTTGLDPESRSRLWDLVRELRTGGTTIVLTTHYLEEAEELADRLAIMHAGAIAISGTLDEVLDAHPATVEATVEARHAVRLPATTTAFELDPIGPDVQLSLRTRSLQRDLTTLLGWAETEGIELRGLRAQTADLNTIFHNLLGDNGRSTT
ncbi:ABC transporter ATP-binding protein [Nocardia sp. CA-290969]|uniref:ABC transporter ATP-binding protein n=1 Tax=Nocardia sp. CA-290969 TaxID=3239986 RepID=UPI003D8BEB4A